MPNQFCFKNKNNYYEILFALINTNMLNLVVSERYNEADIIGYILITKTKELLKAYSIHFQLLTIN